MNICIISPIEGLELYSTLSKTHLVLAHIQDERYVSFYKKRREAGDFLILDNGAHERGESVSWSTLEVALWIYRPQVCILPDVLNNHEKTLSQSLRFLDKNLSRYPHTEWMYVPQTKRGVKLLPEALDDSRIGSYITWIGITRYLAIDHQQSRISIANAIRLFWPKKKLHALGMVKGDLLELAQVRDSNLFESLDTSVPIWRGWNNYLLKGDQPWPEIPVDFSAFGGDVNHKIILSNLEAIGVRKESEVENSHL